MNQNRARLERLHAEISAHLDNDLIPFWDARAQDGAHGGYHTNFNEAGAALPMPMPEKYLNTQCRLLWWFSHLHRLRPAPRRELLARWGADFILEHLWDARHGGFNWKCRADGARLDDGKIVYGQSFAIYALSEYSGATGDARGLDFAAATFNLLQKHAADTRYGGYFENFCGDWTPEADGFAGGDRKSLDTHMHLMEAFTVLYEVSSAELHRRKLLEVTALIRDRLIDGASGCGLNHCDAAWTPIPAIPIKRTWNAECAGDAPATPTDTTSYGHNVELAWLMHRALEVAEADVPPFETTLRRLLDHACEHGVDWETGGIFRDGVRDGAAIVHEKEFWQHAESLVGFLDGYELWGDARHLDAFETLWRFVRAHMIAPAGEWRILLARDGTPLNSDLGNEWKAAYHTGRAALECVERLERLLT